MPKRKIPDDISLREMYVTKRMTSIEIARTCGATKESVCRGLRNAGIPTRKMVGPNHGSWKGGRHIRNGYLQIWNPKHHRANNIGFVADHILVMEKVLGRPVTREEHIHHVDFDRLNNRQENLWITSKKKHKLAEGSVNKLVKQLLANGIIGFDREKGEYVLS